MTNGNYIAPVFKNGKWGYINQLNEIIIPFLFDDADVFSENKAAVNIGGRLNDGGWVEGGSWGVIDAKGNYIVEPYWDLLNPYSCGRSCFREIDRWGYIDEIGNIIVKPIYGMAQDYSENLAVVQNNDRLYGYLGIDGKLAIDFRFSFAYQFKEGIAVAEDAGSWIVIDASGNIVLRQEVRRMQQFINGMAGATNMQRRSGFIDIKGEWAISPLFDDVGWFAEGLAPVSNNGLWGYVNRKGELVIAFLFNKNGSFNEGVAPVMQNNLWGVIDTSGNWIVMPAYDYIYPCTGGLLSFMQEGKAGYMDRSGNIIIPALYDDAKSFVEVTI